MLQKNMMSVLVTILQTKDDSSFELADSTLESIKTVLAKDTISPGAQTSIMENLLNNSGHVAFDKNTSTSGRFKIKNIYIENNFSLDTRFIANVSSFLKKETIVSIVDIYRSFVAESSRTQDKITLIQHLAKYVNKIVSFK